MAIVSVVALVAALAGAIGGYVLSKQAVEWCPSCGRSLAGHCPDMHPMVSARPSAGGRRPVPATDPR